MVMSDLFLVGWDKDVFCVLGLTERIDESMPSITLEFEDFVVVVVVRELGSLMLFIFPHEHEPEGSILVVEFMLYVVSWVLILILGVARFKKFDQVLSHIVRYSISLSYNLKKKSINILITSNYGVLS